MPASRFQMPSTVRENAVSETVKRVNAEALDLLTRRAEINQRIRCLQQVMRALRDLAANTTFHRYDLAQRAPAKDWTRLKGGATPYRRTAVRRRSRIPDRPQQLQAALTRACRIALMEAGGTASPDEIRARIVRRESFSFADSGSAETAIVRTLNFMTHGGEVRRLEGGSQSVWQRTVPTPESDLSM